MTNPFPYLSKPGGPVPRVGRIRQGQMVVRRDSVLEGRDIPGSFGGPIRWNETLIGAVDGANSIFGLAHLPTIPQSVSIFKNGFLQQQGVDYQLSGTEIAFYQAPEAGASFLTTYQ